MFTIKYRPSDYSGIFHVVFGDGWKRLDHCNAATYQLVNNDSYDYTSRICEPFIDSVTTDDIERHFHHTVYLVSYSSVAAQIDLDWYRQSGNPTDCEARITLPSWLRETSLSTMRQVWRFIDHTLIDYHVVAYDDWDTLPRIRQTWKELGKTPRRDSHVPADIDTCLSIREVHDVVLPHDELLSVPIVRTESGHESSVW